MSTEYTPISSVIPTGTTSTTGTKATGKQTLDQEAFLKLLVAQLQYQNPDNPTDATQFMAQTAQFTQVQTLQQVLEEQQQLLSAQLVQSASAMVGRTVTYTRSDGTEGTGVVASATVGSGTPTLQIGTDSVSLSSVTKITK